jgi:hypothetical protein
MKLGAGHVVPLVNASRFQDNAWSGSFPQNKAESGSRPCPWRKPCCLITAGGAGYFRDLRQCQAVGKQSLKRGSGVALQRPGGGSGPSSTVSNPNGRKTKRETGRSKAKGVRRQSWELHVRVLEKSSDPKAMRGAGRDQRRSEDYRGVGRS